MAESESAPVADRRTRIGPGLLITAAFIGPGTVVTASKAGAARGCGLIWTILFACVGTIVLQSLAARVGIIGGRGLGESIREELRMSRVMKPAVVLVIAAIGVGNAAYQTGNLTGAVAGIRSCFGGSHSVWLALLVVSTGSIVLLGRYRWLHRILVSLVALLSASFLFAAACSLPSIDRILSGTLIPRFGSGDLTIVLGLIGTTIVPYNLFLHASSAASTWKGRPVAQSIVQSDWDTVFSVCLGSLVTASILVSASTAFYDTQTSWTSTDDIAQQLHPVLGSSSAVAFAIGLFAAGLTSAITAPIATAYAVCGTLNWPTEPDGRHFRGVALSVVAVGGVVALTFGASPEATIIFAQLANGLLLPIVSIYLLMVVSRKMKTSHAGWEGRTRLILANVVVAVVSMLGIWRIVSLLPF